MSSGGFPALGKESNELRADGLSVYRYWIERRWSEDPGFLLWVMFNPSSATIKEDNGDRAIPICVKRTKRFATDTGLVIGAMRVVNLFARRATAISAERDPWPRAAALNSPVWIGPENDIHIAEQSSLAMLTVAAWGPSLLDDRAAHWRAAQVEAVVSELWCLDVNAKGHPYYAGPRGARVDTDIVPLAEARCRSKY